MESVHQGNQGIVKPDSGPVTLCFGNPAPDFNAPEIVPASDVHK